VYAMAFDVERVIASMVPGLRTAWTAAERREQRRELELAMRLLDSRSAADAGRI
jgi:hypothetical protein